MMECGYVLQKKKARGVAGPECEDLAESREPKRYMNGRPHAAATSILANDVITPPSPMLSECAHPPPGSRTKDPCDLPYGATVPQNTRVSRNV